MTEMSRYLCLKEKKHIGFGKYVYKPYVIVYVYLVSRNKNIQNNFKYNFRTLSTKT